MKLQLGLAIIVAATMSCGPPVPVQAGHQERSALASSMPDTVVRAAIVTVLGRRRHSITADGPGVVRARLGRGPSLDVAIPYRGNGFDVLYENSNGFEVRRDPATQELNRDGVGEVVVDETGTPLLDQRYVRWMQRLRVQIEREIAVQHQAYAEAQERDAEREVDIAVARQRTEEAALARAHVERMPAPAPAQPAAVVPVGAAPAGGGLSAGFNVTRAPNGLGSATVVVVNQSAEHLRLLSFRNTGRREWRPNQLSRTVPPGASYGTQGIVPGRYELRVEDGSSYKEWHHLNLQGGGEYTLVVTSEGWFRL